MKYRAPILAIAFLLVLGSCAENEFHYLHQYVGRYDFKSTFSMDFQPGVDFDKRTFSGDIIIGEEGKLSVHYDPIYTIQVSATTDGVISHPAKTSDLFWGKFYGRDSMEFSYLYPSSPPSNVLLYCVGVRK